MLREYSEGLLIFVSFVALALGLAHPKLKSATSFCAGVLLICAIMLPLVDIFKDFDNEYFIEQLIKDTQYEAYTDDVIESAFEDGVRKYISDKHRIDEKCVAVMADGFDMEKMTAKRIYVTLSGMAALSDYKSIEEEIRREFTDEGECEVSVKIG